MIHASTSALEKAVSAMYGLAESIGSAKGASRDKVQAGLRALRSRMADVKHNLSCLRSELRDLDPEDDDYHYGAGRLRDEIKTLKEEEADLRAADCDGRHLLQKVEAAEARLAKVVDNGIPEAVDYIRSRLQALIEFQRYQLNVSSAGGASSGSPASPFPGGAGALDSSPAPASAPGKPPAAVSLLSIRLPEGFAWLPMARVMEERGLVKDQLHFNKASSGDFEKLLLRFQLELLPELRRSKDLASLRGVCERHDQEQGLYGGDSLANVYDIFFGNNPIRIEKRAMEFDDGRHRSWTAVQLGWTHLPGRYS
jgi:hypothetical protein